MKTTPGIHNQIKQYCPHCEKPQYAPTPGKMFGILSSMSPDGKVYESTIRGALNSNDDPLRAFIVRAVNAYEMDQEIKRELLEALRRAHTELDQKAEGGIFVPVGKTCWLCDSIAKAEASSDGGK